MHPMDHGCDRPESVAPKWDLQIGRELYDHKSDPSDATSFSKWENVNLAYEPAYAETVRELHAQLVARWAKPEH